MSLPLDSWSKTKIGLPEGQTLSGEVIREYQIKKIRDTFELAVANSPFYKEIYGDIPVPESLDDMADIPFTMPKDLALHGEDMICVPQKEISRIVTMETSGTTGTPKRVFFTEEDQELTIDYFHHGMQNLIDDTDRLLILMPYERPGSVGDLLKKGVKRLGARVFCLGLIDDDLSYNTILDVIYNKGITSIVGIPDQVYGLMKHTACLKMKTVLLSGEYVSPKVASDISKIWGCRVFEHYGMREMGLGCAVSCHVLKGYHVRETDIFIEIVDTESRKPVNDGTWGEIVFTTLTRKGMPFIRYRTGDEGRLLKELCPCGSVLKRLDRVRKRRNK